MSALDTWLEWTDAARIWWTRHAMGSLPVGARLAELVRVAREASPLFGGLLAGIPDDAPLDALPITHKADLMADFDAWCTDPRVRRGAVEAFLADRSRIGESLLDRYALWKSSGTTGSTGYFVQDAHALAVYEALVVDHYERAQVDMARVVAAGARRALVSAGGDHFATAALWKHFERSLPSAPGLACSILDPLSRTVASLNDFAPAYLAGYPSALELLAHEQREGRLRIAPALLWAGGEHLGDAARARIEDTFGCEVMNEYGASECLCIAHGCREGWLHVDDDWVLLEPVDAQGRRVAPGTLSHSVLVTNLANHVQPIIRYDLGDRVVEQQGKCACGDASMAIRVEGRTDDTLQVTGTRGATCTLLPLAITTLLDEACGEHRYQLVQKDASRLALRLAAPLGARERQRIGRESLGLLREFLAANGAAGVRLELDRAAPRADASSGKLKNVVALALPPRHPC